MADASVPIPNDWTLKTEVQKDGTKVSFYLCPATGQHFYTYADLIRYVSYAKEAKLSIYSSECKTKKQGCKTKPSARKQTHSSETSRLERNYRVRRQQGV